MARWYFLTIKDGISTRRENWVRVITTTKRTGPCIIVDSVSVKSRYTANFSPCLVKYESPE